METLTTILHILATYLLGFGYWGIFFIALGSSLALPLPASASLSAAAAFASQGYFNIHIVLTLTFLGSVLGDVLGFAIAKHYGKQVLLGMGFFRHIMMSKGYRQVEEYIEDFAPSLIFSSRFMTGISPATNVLAGITGVSYKKFCTYAVLGEVVYVLVYGLAGYLLGTGYQNGTVFVIGGVVTVLFFSFVINAVQVFMYRRKKKG